MGVNGTLTWLAVGAEVRVGRWRRRWGRGGGGGAGGVFLERSDTHSANFAEDGGFSSGRAVHTEILDIIPESSLYWRHFTRCSCDSQRRLLGEFQALFFVKNSDSAVDSPGAVRTRKSGHYFNERQVVGVESCGDGFFFSALRHFSDSFSRS